MSVTILYRKSPRTEWEFVIHSTKLEYASASADATLAQQRAIGDKHGQVMVVDRAAYEAGKIVRLYTARAQSTKDIVAGAKQFAEQKRAEGWTKETAVESLKEMLDSNSP